MKKLLMICAFVLTTFLANSQTHSVGLSYDYLYASGVTNFANLEGAGSISHQKGNKLALNYAFQVREKLRIVSGLQYQQNWMQNSNSSSTAELQTWDFKVETLNIPIYANLTFLEYLFVEGGPLLNFQMNQVDDYGIEDQSGIGFGAALGLQYSLKRINFFIKSQGQIQTLIPFAKENYHGRILTNSVSLGFFIAL